MAYIKIMTKEYHGCKDTYCIINTEQIVSIIPNSHKEFGFDYYVYTPDKIACCVTKSEAQKIFNVIGISL